MVRNVSAYIIHFLVKRGMFVKTYVDITVSIFPLKKGVYGDE